MDKRPRPSPPAAGAILGGLVVRLEIQRPCRIIHGKERLKPAGTRHRAPALRLRLGSGDCRPSLFRTPNEPQVSGSDIHVQVKQSVSFGGCAKGV
jgi:hypothetical protein